MSLGGGTFTEKNKVLPGAYINSVSKGRKRGYFTDNGVVAIAIPSTWGNPGEIIELYTDDFEERCREIFGMDSYTEELKGVRELMANARKVYIGLIGTSKKASNNLAEAQKMGTRGNSIAIKIQKSVDEEDKKEVITLLDNIVVDKQIVTNSSELLDNDLVKFKKGALETTVKNSLEGGANGGNLNEQHKAFLDAIEVLEFNALGCLATDPTVQKMYISFTKRLREENNNKFALICKYLDSVEYNHEGIVTVINDVAKGTEYIGAFSEHIRGSELVYYTTGIYASCLIGKSNLNKVYDGEYEVNTNYKQFELRNFIKKGIFAYHLVGDTVRVLDDINSLIKTTKEKDIEFKDNQVVRIIDGLTRADAKVFIEEYLGVVNIDKAGLESLTNRLTELRTELQNRGAIKNFKNEDVRVTKVEGGARGAVQVDSAITPAEAFRQMYLTNVIHG